jgi:hypothetical protein
MIASTVQYAENIYMSYIGACPSNFAYIRQQEGASCCRSERTDVRSSGS